MKDWTPSNDRSVLWRLDKGRPEAAGTFCFIRTNKDERAQPALLADSFRLWLHSDKRWRAFSCILKLIWNNLSSHLYFFCSCLSQKNQRHSSAAATLHFFCCSENAMLWWNVRGRPLSLQPDLNYPLHRILQGCRLTTDECGSHLPPVWRSRRQGRSWLTQSQQISKSVWVFKKETDKRGKKDEQKYLLGKLQRQNNRQWEIKLQIQLRLLFFR